MGKEGVCYPGLRPLRKAVEAAEATGLPIMCHISDSRPPLTASWRCCARRHRHPRLHRRRAAAGRQPRPGSPRRAAGREAGIRFDIGHGAGSFSFASAEALARHGFWPDTISTDLHQISLPGPNLIEDQEMMPRVRGDGTPRLTLLTVMTKFLVLGMPWSKSVRATTIAPAAMIGRGDWVRTPHARARGRRGDPERRPGPVDLVDIYGNRRQGDRALRSIRTFVAGRQLEPRPSAAGAALDPPGRRGARWCGQEVPMKTALMVFASDLIDEGFEAVADVARDRGGFEAIELAAIYHHARDVHPHNPYTGSVSGWGSALFSPRSSSIQRQRIQPHLAGVLDEVDPLRQLLAVGRARDLSVRAWTINLHNYTLGERYPDAAVENAFGDRLLTDLCPANPMCALTSGRPRRTCPDRGGCHRGRVDLLHALRPRLPSRADALPTQRDDPVLPQPLLLPHCQARARKAGCRARATARGSPRRVGSCPARRRQPFR